MSVIVFGSLNMDLVAQTPRLPLKGETVKGTTFLQVPGGKGANQAVAVARLGRETYMIGRVGNDLFGEELLTALTTQKVNTDGVTITPNVSSGVAVIAVDKNADNHIIVISGANGYLDETDGKKVTALLPKASTILLQLEVPLPMVITVAKAAKAAGVKVILDPAPIPDQFPDELYSLADIITPNEIEASRLVGFPITDLTSYQKAADVLRSRGVSVVVLTLGEKGVFYADGSESFLVPPFNVIPVDTVAAGDAFNGGMAAAIDQGLSLKEAIKWGAATGALATTKKGAFSSLPNKETFEAFLQTNSP
ncbi:MAG: ribokinase [Microcystaceae cyanobacterium]